LRTATTDMDGFIFSAVGKEFRLKSYFLLELGMGQQPQEAI